MKKKGHRKLWATPAILGTTRALLHELLDKIFFSTINVVIPVTDQQSDIMLTRRELVEKIPAS
jgi:hypothetical protein